MNVTLDMSGGSPAAKRQRGGGVQPSGPWPIPSPRGQSPSHEDFQSPPPKQKAPTSARPSPSHAVPTPAGRSAPKLVSLPSFSGWVLGASPDENSPASAWERQREQQQQQQQGAAAGDLSDVLANYAGALPQPPPPSSPLDHLLEKLDRDMPAAVFAFGSVDWQQQRAAPGAPASGA